MLKIIYIKRRADGFIGVIFQFAIIMSLIFCFIALWKPFIYKQNLDYMAKTLVRAVEANGRIDGSITDLQNQLKSELGINPTIAWSTTYISGTNKIQIRQKFTLFVSDAVTIKLIEPSFSAPLSIKIPVNKKFIGISQVFWK